ncbi:type IV pili methyl-accepting chemotaxis transducer N-terminal domain-containing protein [Vibrio viridaestus]|uniref:Sensor protein n=1 Tax=Vibrio viridaestus TaxID=2487322 RepID=A0A3N9TDS5_9VIBR|nr:type IV pili methyl-accepting chemotaxis transducer N-terminal domain-containing protein [Vibrio viridaestus]RQW61853.1 HAMP domain-containing protein [Vibrio viridaestus]
MPLIIKKLSHSVVLRITSLMISVILMAFISIFSSIYMSQISEFDGKTINLSGSLRMMSYRITTQVAALQQSPTKENSEKVATLIKRFETLFRDPVLKRDFFRFSEIQLQREYSNVNTEWENVIKPKLAHADTDFDLEEFLPHLEAFVDSIDTLVFSYQNVLEDKLSQLRMIQTVTLAITLFLVLVSIYTIHRHIARPLRELTVVAEASSNGDWSQRCSVKREDELGLLSRTLNKANESIQTIHNDQEKQIQAKTHELRKNNEILTFLYNVAQQVNESHSGRLNYQQILNELVLVSDIERIELKLFSDTNSVPYQQVLATNQIPHSDNSSSLVFTIGKAELAYGSVTVFHPTAKPIDRWQTDLVQSFVDQIAMALSLSHYHDQQRRIALLDERSIIARELHDSLAQSLSYLKIQVTRIERGMKDEIVSDKITKPVSELKEGLISAYRQLRELLTTFRLQIGNGGLQDALTNTIQTLTERSQIEIKLQYDCNHIPFEPNEEIHLLQITKEALQNALNHSKGNLVVITLTEAENKSIHLRVKDNGIGIKHKEQQLNHYGTEIMQERCRSLNGDLKIITPEDGGTEVNLSFMPNYLNKSV